MIVTSPTDQVEGGDELGGGARSPGEVSDTSAGVGKSVKSSRRGSDVYDAATGLYHDQFSGLTFNYNPETADDKGYYDYAGKYQYFTTPEQEAAKQAEDA